MICWISIGATPQHYVFKLGQWHGDADRQRPPTTTHLNGGFQITGVAACNSPEGGEFKMTGSTATTISSLRF